MHILLTDRLTCPRCGPEFGLVVLADRLEDRLVMEGRLGCPNCRERFPILNGVADLRHPSQGAIEVVVGGSGEAEQAFRTAALLGVQAANASVLVIEPGGDVSAAIAELLPEVHVLALSAGEGRAESPERGILSRFRAGQGIPLKTASVSGVGALGIQVEPLLDEIHRVLVPGGRLVVDPSPDGLTEPLGAAGFTVLLEQEGVTVAAASGPG